MVFERYFTKVILPPACLIMACLASDLATAQRSASSEPQSQAPNYQESYQKSYQDSFKNRRKDGHNDNGVRYNFVEFGFVDFDTDGPVDGDGFLFRGSYRLDQDFFLTGSYTSLESDGNFLFDSNLELSIMSFGAGFIIPNNKVDFSAQFALLKADADPGDSESGFHMKFGGRTYLQNNLEIYGSSNYRNITDSDTFLQAGMSYFIDSAFSIGMSLDLMGDLDQIVFQGRYYFN
jgi:hypothetical protein